MNTYQNYLTTMHISTHQAERISVPAASHLVWLLGNEYNHAELTEQGEELVVRKVSHWFADDCPGDNRLNHF